MHSTQGGDKDVTLLDLLDRILTKGVYIWGDITLCVADVDLVYLGLRVLLCSVDKANELRRVSLACPLPLPTAAAQGGEA